MKGLIEFRFEMRVPYYLAIVAEAFINHGRDEEARILLEDAKMRVAAHGYVEQALASENSMNSRSMSLRCAIDMARLLKTRGNQDAARSVLGPVYAQFTEGHATKDLIAARELIECDVARSRL